MATKKYLDEAGLARLWAKIKASGGGGGGPASTIYGVGYDSMDTSVSAYGVKGASTDITAYTDGLTILVDLPVMTADDYFYYGVNNLGLHQVYDMNGARVWASELAMTTNGTYAVLYYMEASEAWLMLSPTLAPSTSWATANISGTDVRLYPGSDFHCVHGSMIYARFDSDCPAEATATIRLGSTSFYTGSIRKLDGDYIEAGDITAGKVAAIMIDKTNQNEYRLVNVF